MDNTFNITKKEIENYLGYEINNFRVEEAYIEGVCRGLNILVKPRHFIKTIETSIKINNGVVLPLTID